MKAMWAPWRIDYVRRKKEAGCFLCRALKSDDDRTHLLLKRGRACGIMLNRHPYCGGHLMVFPFRHVPDVLSLNSEERLESMDLVSEAVEALKRSIQADGFNVGLNLGKAAGAGLDEHLHVHVVPRWEGDTNFMPVVANTSIVPQALLELWDQLRPEFQA